MECDVSGSTVCLRQPHVLNQLEATQKTLPQSSVLVVTESTSWAITSRHFVDVVHD